MSPKKYLTDEDKRRANCEKSKRSYEKRRREINRKRREEYHRRIRRGLKAVADEEQRQREKSPDPRLRERLREMTIEDTLADARKLFQDFETLIRGSTKVFMISLCETYLARRVICVESAQAMVDNYHKRLTRYQTLLYDYRNRIWNLAGVGKEFKEVDMLGKSVVEVIIWLEDLQCAELDPSQSVAKMFRKKEFSFQQ